MINSVSFFHKAASFAWITFLIVSGAIILAAIVLMAFASWRSRNKNPHPEGSFEAFRYDMGYYGLEQAPCGGMISFYPKYAAEERIPRYGREGMIENCLKVAEQAKDRYDEWAYLAFQILYHSGDETTLQRVLAIREQYRKEAGLPKETDDYPEPFRQWHWWSGLAFQLSRRLGRPVPPDVAEDENDKCDLEGDDQQRSWL